MASATAQVLNIPELLEQILSYSSQSDLMTQRQVNTKWNDIVSTSDSCQKALFLKPIKKDIQRKITHDDYQINPILDALQSKKQLVPAKREPWPTIDLKDLRRLYMAEGHWKRMFTTQPASQLIYITVSWPIEEWYSTPTLTCFSNYVFKSSGITVEDVVNFVDVKMEGLSCDEDWSPGRVDRNSIVVEMLPRLLLSSANVTALDAYGMLRPFSEFHQTGFVDLDSDPSVERPNCWRTLGACTYVYVPGRICKKRQA